MADSGPDERTLIQRVARGDAEAFEILVRNYEPRLLNFLSRVTGRPEVAQEVAQEALIKAFYKAHTFHFRCSFYTWLCEIAVHKFLDWRKQRKRWYRKHAVTDMQEQSFDRPDRMPGPVELAESLEVQQQVRAGIAQLSPDHQTVLILRELQGASYEEIAAAMKCSVGTVESRLFRARQKLKEILQPVMKKHEL